MPSRRGVTANAARKIMLAHPGVTEGMSYGTPSWLLRKKFVARFRDNDTVLVVKCGDIERDLRLAADPRAFFLTDHYVGYPTVLIRLAEVRETDLREVCEVAWRRQASKKQLAERPR